MTTPAGSCLNCGAALHGAFCAACGQRAIPPNPTVRELAGDAWQELSGYDGRIMATIRGLVRPGFLTTEYLAGRRARFLPPVRVYLIVSVIYFVTAAAAPNISASRRPGEISGPGGLRIGVSQQSGMPDLTPEEQAAVLAQAERAPWFLRPLLRAIATDPEGFRARVLTIMPRVFFGLLPVFAAILALFYRGRPWPVFLVFAAHLHAFAFVAFTVSELAKFTRAPMLAAGVGLVVAGAFGVYALAALRRVFGGGWPGTLAKAGGVAVLYLLASLPAFVVILAWASWA